jgi:2-oxoglutarate ferredoxin oxidoreductase subunit beta
MGSEEITVDYEPGTVQEVVFDNGNRVLLRKLDRDYDATSRIEALRTMHEGRERGELVTGLLYVDTSTHDLCERERLPKRGLAHMNEDELRISRDQWSELMASFA